MKLKLKALVLVLFCMVAQLAFAETEGTVTADLLNVRLAPELKSVVVAKLANGAKVLVHRAAGDFYEISAPNKMPVYVSAIYLRDGKVLSPVKMRTAMDRHAATFGTLPAGAVVEILQENSLGWAKITPPDSLKVYAAKNFINLTSELKESESAKPVATEQAAPSEEKAKKLAVDVRSIGESSKVQTQGDTAAPKAETPAVPAKPKDSTESTAKPAKSTPQAKTTEKPEPVNPLEEQLKSLGIDLSKSKLVTVEGVLVEIPNTTVDAIKYAVLKLNAQGQYVKSCFVCSSEASLLKNAAEKNVRLTGAAYSVPTWETPVVKVTSLELVK